MELLEKETCKISVSSVLDRNGKEYGKQFLLDGEEDTCWNSDQVRETPAKVGQRAIQKLTFVQGIPQYIRVTLNDKQKSTKLMLKIQFQGGFCGKESEICFKNGSEEVLTHNFYPKGRI